MLDNLKKDIKILCKKIGFRLNKNRVYINVDGNLVNRTKVPLLKIIKGIGIDVGCGSDKISDKAIGVDIIGRGEIGKYGCEKNKKSKADIKASGDNLHMFSKSSLDFVIARDNLEHYIDFLRALKEWNRVLRVHGKLGITTPNDNEIDSIRLDPSHKHAFNIQSLETALNLTGFKVIEKGITIKGWGFYIIAEKIREIKYG